jgi:hypothetical protein
MDYRQISRVLKSAGKAVASWESPDGTRALILPHGGRVLGLFTAADAENFFWTHPDLAAVKSARRFYQNEEWQNSGGDRTWLAPEVDFFLPEYPNTDRYWVQRELDPGQYQMSRKNGTVILTNAAELTLSRQEQPIQLTLIKSVSPAMNPLRYEDKRLSSIKYAGYTLRCKLQLDDTATEVAGVGLWNLLQLPHGGDMLVPIFGRSEPTFYLGDISRGDLVLSERLLQYKMRAPGEHKLGVRAITTSGRAGYMYNVSNDIALVIRSFNVNPSGEYVDVHWREPNKPGSAFQACNVYNQLGAFSELEYHAPAIGPQLKRLSCEDESQVWAFRGNETEILSVARLLLSPDI